MEFETNLQSIAEFANEKQEENDHFRGFVKQFSGVHLDELVFDINQMVSDAVDCTTCGNCCNSLMINVTKPEIGLLAQHLNRTEEEIKETFVEESHSGNFVINTIPCHFLNEKKCTIYEARFSECREFPHLHKPGFKDRLLGTLLHYGSCPIIYNVIDEVKSKTGFYISGDAVFIPKEGNLE